MCGYVSVGTKEIIAPRRVKIVKSEVELRWCDGFVVECGKLRRIAVGADLRLFDGPVDMRKRLRISKGLGSRAEVVVRPRGVGTGTSPRF